MRNPQKSSDSLWIVQRSPTARQKKTTRDLGDLARAMRRLDSTIPADYRWDSMESISTSRLVMRLRRTDPLLSSTDLIRWIDRVTDVP